LSLVGFYEDDPRQENSSLSIISPTNLKSDKLSSDLWNFITNKDFIKGHNNEFMFKMKQPKKLYLQVKASLINENSETILFLNDFT